MPNPATPKTLVVHLWFGTSLPGFTHVSSDLKASHTLKSVSFLVGSRPFDFALEKMLDLGMGWVGLAKNLIYILCPNRSEGVWPFGTAGWNS